MPLVKPVLVVHYVLLGNDIHELDRPSICCGWGPLVRYSDGEAVGRRCPEAVYDAPLQELVALSPAPFAARLAASRSTLATQMVLGFNGINSWIARASPVGGARGYQLHVTEESFRHFASVERGIEATVEAAGADLVVVLLISRQSATAAIGEEPIALDLWQGKGTEARARVLAILRDARLDVIDTRDFMETLVRSDDEGRWFTRDMPGDFHFSPLGHERFAAWLWPQLRRRLARQASS
jgi:hypothetical protein